LKIKNLNKSLALKEVQYKESNCRMKEMESVLAKSKEELDKYALKAYILN